MLNKNLFFFIFLISFIFPQNIWTGNSVATSDNLDAFSLNPAGFGLDRGYLTGLYAPINNENLELIQGIRTGNFGYLLKYTDKRPEPLQHQPSEFKIGLGFEAGKGNYIGFLWNQNKNGEGSFMQIENNFVFGGIIRPWNFLSLGGTVSVDEDRNISSNRLGLAIRPLSNQRLTVGVDYSMSNYLNIEKNTIHPFVNLKLIDGFNIGFSATLDPEKQDIDPSYKPSNKSV